MAITWPSSVPTALISTPDFGAIDPWVTDPAEVGAGRRRKRFTRSLKSFNFAIRITDAQLETLTTFYEATLSDGVFSFTWVHPRTAAVYTVRFVERFREQQHKLGLWDVPISLEEI